MAIRPRRISLTLERKIHFYRADAGVDDGGRPRPFNSIPPLRIIATLPFADGQASHYLVDDDGNALGVWADASTSRTALRFCQVRRTGLPQLEHAGNVSDLNIAAVDPQRAQRRRAHQFDPLRRTQRSLWSDASGDRRGARPPARDPWVVFLKRIDRPSARSISMDGSPVASRF
jgi:hypothetical protein